VLDNGRGVGRASNSGIGGAKERESGGEEVADHADFAACAEPRGDYSEAVMEVHLCAEQCAGEPRDSGADAAQGAEGTSRRVADARLDCACAGRDRRAREAGESMAAVRGRGRLRKPEGADR
jgi:hypothetical protein